MNRTVARNTRWLLITAFFAIAASAGFTMDKWQWWVCTVLLGIAMGIGADHA